MLQSTHFDPVLGLDTHIVGVPAPPAPAPIPTPIPMPFVGMVFDPAGLAIGAAISMALGGGPGLVLVNGLPVTNCGTNVTNKLTMPHLPAPGVTFIPPPTPSNDALLFFGSLNATLGGSYGVRLGDIALSCNDPVRLPVSAVLAIPKGPLVLNLKPMAPDVAAIAMALAMRGIAKGLGALARRGAALFRRFRARSPFFQRLSQRLGGCEAPNGASRWRQMWSRGVRFVTGHPVDVVTGNLFTQAIDARLPGPLPLVIERVYESAGSGVRGSLGYGWSHSLEETLWMERGRAVVRGGDGREIEFPLWDLPERRMRPGDVVDRVIHKMRLRCVGHDRYEVEHADGRVHELGPVVGGEAGKLRLLRIRSRDGHHAIDVTYDEDGRIEWVRDSGGRLLKLEHDAEGRLVALKLPLPNGDGWYQHRRYVYDAEGDLVSVEDALGNAWAYLYRSHLLVQERDRAGFSFYFQYDGAGPQSKCVRTWGDGGVYDHVIAYDEANRKTFVEDSQGHVTAYAFNERNQVVSRTNPLGQVETWDYDPDTGGVLAHQDPAGAVTASRYDARGNLREVQYADGTGARFEYDDNGLRVGAVDPVGGVWRWEVGAGGHVLARARPTGEREAYVWDRGLLVRNVDAAGRAVTMSYDEHKNLVAVSLPGGGTFRFAYDRLGRRVKTTDPRGGVTRSRFDLEGRLIETQRPTGGVYKVSYTAEGHVTEADGPTSRIRFRYGEYHRVVRREEGGAGVEFQYDSEGRLTGVTNGIGERYRFVLDAVGRVEQEIGFDGRTHTHLRDARGKVLESTAPSGRRRKRQYDVRGRLVRVDSSDGTFVAFKYRDDGFIVEAENESATVVFERDAVGRIVGETVGGVAVRSRLAPGGARVEVESSLGARVRRQLDDDGRIERLFFDGNASTSTSMSIPWGAAPAVELRRDALGSEQQIRFENGIEVDWERDLAGNPVARRTYRRSEGVDGREEIDARTHQWQGDARIRAILDAAAGPRTFDFDDKGGLIREHRPDQVLDRALDGARNVYRSADGTDRRYAPGGRLETAAGGVRFERDADGHQIRRTDGDGRAWTYAWNDSGLLAAVETPDGDRVEFAYDAFARRIAKRRVRPDGTPDHETRFVWDGNVVLHEIDSEEGVTTWHWAPGTFTPIAREKGGHRSYVVSDHLGTPTAMYDSSGRLAWSMRMDVFGGCTFEAGRRADCPWRWPGQYDDEDAGGLVYNRHRYYAPAQGTYLSDDPLFLLMDSAQGYCPDPVNQFDPLGWHVAQAWFTPPGGTRTPVGNPAMGGENWWPNTPGSGDADMAPSGLGRLGDSENHIMEHLADTRGDSMSGGILEITSTRAHGSSLPSCDMCGEGMQTFADRYGVTVSYSRNGRHGPVGDPEIYHPGAGGCQ